MNEELKKRILSSILLISIVTFIIFKGSVFFNIFLIICFFIILFEWYIISKKKTYCYIGIFFITFSFYTIYKIYNFNKDYQIFLFVLLICISTDIGGYVFGKLFKGRKLTSISPNKTYSGVIGSYIFSLIFLTIFFQLSLFFFNKIDLILSTYIKIILISSVSQLGDILVSYFKRLSNVKDTGNIIPGHGGLLDRADGIIFAFPFSYLLLLTNIELF